MCAPQARAPRAMRAPRPAAHQSKAMSLVPMLMSSALSAPRNALPTPSALAAAPRCSSTDSLARASGSLTLAVPNSDRAGATDAGSAMPAFFIAIRPVITCVTCGRSARARGRRRADTLACGRPAAGRKQHASAHAACKLEGRMMRAPCACPSNARTLSSKQVGSPTSANGVMHLGPVKQTSTLR